MGIKKQTRELPGRLEGVRKRIERWRRTRKVRSPIPEPLWAAAVEMANVYGMNRTAEALRLNYYGLKKRMVRQAASAVGVSEAKNETRFVELAPFSSGGCCECLLELENGEARMRIQLKGVAVPDLTALSQAFWNSQP